ncbi:tyrosine-type recombinase/integrase [Megasphaera sp. UBA4233]|uniref:tyrosine-type recombinase/integrase n=1 Tax=Megasphaera sp. UBA4233 TaxID=1946847 RepID=UPI000ED23F06|nr:tyrosine-type recombinase/integrase [Megasphaera sp. UBA4233]HAM05391.1 recombinase XerC [Megasphaera sp.]
MRKPNGYGSIKRLSGTRRRPFVFVVSEHGRQKPVEYFATQVEAEIFAADYNKIHRNRSLPGHKITFAELYHRWITRHIADTSPSDSAITGYRNSYRHCSVLHGMEYEKIKYQDYQTVIDGMRRSGLSYSSLKKVRSLISLMAFYAIKIDMPCRNYAPLLSLGRNKPVHPHKTFSRQKINRLWSIANHNGVDTILILLYTGMRVGELLALQKSDINLRQQIIRITHSKTAAGIRIIPIHHRIQPFITYRMQSSGTYLITDSNGRSYDYSRYCLIWRRIMHDIHADGHTTHDCRHTVATLLDNAGANETARRRILGHAGGDVTERVYTHKNLRQLRKCIELLK